MVTLVVLDSCHFSIHRGSIYWSPGYGILLMGSSRVAIMAFMADLWLVGYSLAFVVYGGALVSEVSVNSCRIGGGLAVKSSKEVRIPFGAISSFSRRVHEREGA